MISVLAWNLDEATKALEKEGFSVSTREIRSKKGVEGDSKRVIRQRLTDESTVELCFAQIKSKPAKEQ